MKSMKIQVLLLFSLTVITLILECTAQKKMHHLNLPRGVTGPESTAFDCHGGGPYVGVSDGRILKWQSLPRKWIDFAVTVAAVTVANRSQLCNKGLRVDTSDEAYCGRPLGLKFNPITCELYIADAYSGLMKVGPNGGVAKQLVHTLPLHLTNDLDIHPKSGLVYFTDSSTVYSRRQWYQAIEAIDKTGRLILYDPNDGHTSILLNGLAFANGVALSADGSFILVAETSTGQIQRYWLKGLKSHTKELFIQLGGGPDNVKRNANGNFWIAQTQNLPSSSVAQKTKDKGRPLKVDASGKILEILGDTGYTSEVTEFNNRLWLGSVIDSYVGIL